MHMQAHIAGIYLPEIDDIDFGGGLGNPLDGQRLDDAQRRRSIGAHYTGIVDYLDKMPILIGVAYLFPAMGDAGVVDSRTHIKICGADMAVVGTPLRITGDGMRASVSASDIETTAQGGEVTVAREIVFESQIPTIPAVTKHGSNGIAIALEQAGDIKGLVHHAVVVIAPTGGEDPITDDLPIELDFV